MKIYIVTAIMLLFSAGAFSQDPLIDVLTEIETNNTRLGAFRQQMEARSLGNRTGIFLQNPEFEYAWFAGSPADLGNKTGISARQQFDFPTAYRHRSVLANARNEQLQQEYRQLRSDVLMEARLNLLEWIHVNTLLRELEKRQAHAKSMADAHTRMLELGEINIIDYNKVRLNLLDVRNRVQQLAIEQRRVAEKITAMNGGNSPQQLPQSYPVGVIDDNFETWFERMKELNPELHRLQQEVEISRREQQLQKAENMPSFHVGYVSELLAHEQFRGVAAGISIPLWENKNTLRRARAHTEALQLQLADEHLQFYHLLRAEHARAQSLQQIYQEYRQLFSGLDNTDLLTRAWQAGQINLTEYLLELSYYYQGTDTLLEMELELQKALTVLYKYAY